MGDYDIDQSIVTIKHMETREKIGIGFLAGARLIITCTHVYEDAKNNDRVKVAFNLMESTEEATEEFIAYVRLRYSKNIGISGQCEIYDVTVLEIDSAADLPKKARPAHVSYESGKALVNRECKVYGWPNDAKFDEWIDVRISKAVQGNLFQVEFEKDYRKVKKGFSGSPVWDERNEIVVGIINETEPLSARMIPGYIINKALNCLGEKSCTHRVELGDELSHKKCNRHFQKNLFRQSIDGVHSGYRPQIHLLPGHRSSNHKSLIDVLIEDELRDAMLSNGMASEWKVERNYANCPKGSSLSLCQNCFTSELGKKLSMGNKLAINEILSGYLDNNRGENTAIVLCHEIQMAEWTTPEFVKFFRWYMDHLLKLSVSGQTVLFIFFNLFYPDLVNSPSRYDGIIRKKIRDFSYSMLRKQISGIKEAFQDRLQIELHDFLGKLTFSDIDSWATEQWPGEDDGVNPACLHEIDCENRKCLFDIYRKKRECINKATCENKKMPMQEVEKCLKTQLKMLIEQKVYNSVHII